MSSAKGRLFSLGLDELNIAHVGYMGRLLRLLQDSLDDK